MLRRDFRWRMLCHFRSPLRRFSALFIALQPELSDNWLSDSDALSLLE
jgi:hypothetical protein